MAGRTRIPSPEVREKLSTVTPADLEAELELRRSVEERNSLRYQREQGWLDYHDRLSSVLRDFARSEGQFIRIEGVVGYMNAIHDRLRRTPLPQLPGTDELRTPFTVGEREN